MRPPSSAPPRSPVFTTVEPKVPRSWRGVPEGIGSIVLGIAAPVVPPFFFGPLGTLLGIFILGVGAMAIAFMARLRGADALGLFATLFIPMCILGGLLVWFRQHVYPLFF